MLKVPQEAIDYAENIIKTGTDEEILALFSFKEEEPREMIAFKFQYWAYKVFGRYFQSEPADFHSDFVLNMLGMYYGEHNYLNLGFRGCAKRQPSTSKVLTPNGYKLMGDVAVGDYVIGSKGQPVHVDYVTPIHDGPVMELVLEDGRKVECDPDHIWSVRRMSNTKEKTLVIDTKTMVEVGLYYDRLDKRTGKEYKEYKYALEPVQPVQFPAKDLLIEPYTLGVILGDGSISDKAQVRIHLHENDEETYRKYIPELSKNVYRDKRRPTTLTIGVLGLGPKIRELGIIQTCYTKRVPEMYLYGSIEQRRAILEGLMDTDGTAGAGSPSFTSVSKGLAEDVAHLVRSLGGRASITENNWKGKRSYRVNIRFTDYKPFRLERKLAKCNLQKNAFTRIVDIVPKENAPGRCIKVSTEDGLYVTDDFVVTHNTTYTKLFLVYVLLNDMEHRRKYIKVLTRNFGNAKQIVTDIFNMIVECKPLYGNVLYKEKDQKREETMASFTTTDGVKLMAGTIGMSQRGHIQDAYRPDMLCHQKGTRIFDNGMWMNVEEHPNLLGIRKEVGKRVKLNSLPYPETVTNEHRYWCKHIIKNRQQKLEDIGDDWVEAQNLTKKHYIGLPIDQTIIPIPPLPAYYPHIIRNEKGQVVSTISSLVEKDVPELQDPDFWWLIGLWWGDGNLGSKKDFAKNSATVALTIAHSQPHIYEKVIDILTKYNRKYSITQKIGCSQILFSHSILSRFLRGWYIGGNSQKRPPQWVEYIDHKFQEQLVHGYIAADGFIDHKSKAVRITSVSLEGLYSLRRILARLGVASSIRNGFLGGRRWINSMWCNTQKKYDLRFSNGLGYNFPTTDRYAYARTFVADGFLWTKVMSVTDSHEVEFCPITTKDHTYLTNFGKSHNCFDDVEDRESISSLAQTEATIWRIDEAIQGLAADGAYMVNGNYISDEGVIQWFLNKPRIKADLIAIQDEDGNPTWPARYDKEKIAKIKDDADDFYGEYMCDPSRADTAFFERARVDADIDTAKQPDYEVAGAKFWTAYQPHHIYAIGADTSEGIGKDANTFVLWDFGTFPDDVAKLGGTYYNNRIPPDLFGHELVRVGRDFGNCLIAPEANNTGHATLGAMRGYPYIFTQVNADSRSLKRTERLGWRTTRKTKPQMFFEFRKDYNDGKMKIYDINVLKEMRSYTSADLTGTQTGMVTRHFDLLMAAVIGWQMKKYATWNTNSHEEWEEEEAQFLDIGL